MPIATSEQNFLDSAIRSETPRINRAFRELLCASRCIPPVAITEHALSCSARCANPSEVEDAFRDLFPSVYAFIRQYNQDGFEHANLIRQLQREESKLVIETVCADLIKRYPDMFILTLHDAIFTTEPNIATVTDGFERAFKQMNFPMSLKIGD